MTIHVEGTPKEVLEFLSLMRGSEAVKPNVASPGSVPSAWEVMVLETPVNILRASLAMRETVQLPLGACRDLLLADVPNVVYTGTYLQAALLQYDLKAAGCIVAMRLAA